ncbi:vacuolar protein sorting-associated protein 13 [Macrolepiota fuliginosa MF-IS2]|uniref:Vacuolar protein sorting-associated protein 13 n=1 Tax=Macrolepiota fuliginosa MF-IS2 TaxID=1400762 RepID=A0A9P5XMZ6_9AGAR|nr:vacuolar protein sorting-associated protein 13 [Macrolepiota fuliginosa MF-IS2]
MWWLDPGKELLNVLFNRILAPYVENLDLNQVNYGIGQGQLTLRKLRLKKGALDKFQLPVDVLEGHLGTFTLSLHWMNLGNQPVEILIEDVYLLVVPTAENYADPEEEEQRAQAAKAERLENAELLHMQGQTEGLKESPQTQGLWQSLLNKIINNVQVTVKNIHIRYEDKYSVPGHPFAGGLTLASFSAVSVNERWEPAFIESMAGSIHKLSKLESLALYFDTDSGSMAGLPPAEALQKFTAMITHGPESTNHQFILKPVSGEGRVIVNHRIDSHTPRFDIQLLFDEIGVALDRDQYRDVLSLLDMYHVYLRQHQYRKYRPNDEEFSANTAKARLQYAGRAILGEVQERNYKWTWSYFAERRDDRNRYIGLFQKKLLAPLGGKDLEDYQSLERKLPYEDLRFYRSLARSRLRKDEALRKQLEEEKRQQQAPKQTWSSWLWGGSSQPAEQMDVFKGEMTDEQRQQLYDALDYDEKEALSHTLEAPRDSLKTRITAKLRTGSFALKTNPHDGSKDILSTVFDTFHANILQRPDNLEASLSLKAFKVFDGTTTNTLHSQIVRVKTSMQSQQQSRNNEEPFFFVKYESKPLDGRADNALTLTMRHMEIIYHRGYVEAVYKFFKPPPSQLESVEALLNVASQTLEGLRKETRAGLEYALQNHKTIDIQMDLNAPIIIIPEDITTNHCRHLVIDAGHIAIESDLVDKEAIRSIQSKRNQQYDDEDYRQLESLMYDKLLLRLEDAQFVIGDSLDACLDALAPESRDALHLLERINVSLDVQKSIVPTAINLARFKVAGNLPSLHVNLSDSKYKALMRLVDVCIPKFDDNDQKTTKSAVPPQGNLPAFQIPIGLFGSASPDLNIEDQETDEHDGSDSAQTDTFFEAEENLQTGHDHHQQLFRIDFRVGLLQASLFKSASASERRLGDLKLEGFALTFGLAEYDMKVNVQLRSITTALMGPNAQPVNVITCEPSTTASTGDLLNVVYTRVQKNSPDYNTLYEGIDQSVDVRVSTIVLHAAPEPIISLYDFIMTTFVSSTGDVSPNSANSTPEGTTQSSADESKIRVCVKLESVRAELINESLSLATLSLSTADVAILLRPRTMRIVGRLGSLALVNNLDVHHVHEEFNQILSIEGQNFAEFTYQTYDTSALHGASPSSFSLNAASLKFLFLEQSLHSIYAYLIKLAKLKDLYDAATQAAVQSAPDIGQMHFEITVKSPIIVIPSSPSQSGDVLVMRLGEIDARNKSDSKTNSISASLHGIQLVSNFSQGEQVDILKMIDDINISAEVVQTIGLDRDVDTSYPDMQVVVQISDVKLHLTQTQYKTLLNLSQSVSRVFIIDSGSELELQYPAAVSTHSLTETDHSSINLEPELRTGDGAHKIWTTVDLVVSVGAVKLHLYDTGAHCESDLQQHGIARFALNNTTLRYKALSDGAAEAQLILKSFTMSNTKPGPTRFREIIPAAQHDRNQFMVLYSTASGPTGTTLAVVTVDSPQIIFSIDPVFALLEFFQVQAGSESGSVDQSNYQAQASVSEPQRTLDFRFDLHDVAISVLENDQDSNTQAIRLVIQQILISQQGITALKIDQLGMSLVQMGERTETVKFLDEFDLTLSSDSRSTASQQTMNLELTAKPIVIRASYRDINLITSTFNKAFERLASSGGASNVTVQAMDTKQSQKTTIITKSSRSKEQPIGKARVRMTKQQLKGSFDGFRLILIGDLHEQPMLHLKVKPFIIGAKDWSTELHATVTMAVQITFWNLMNSHWEPLIDPWTFTVTAAKEKAEGGMSLALSARERLDINLTSAFAEVATTTLNMWNREGKNVLQKARGTYAPYRIRNRTGASLLVWSEADDNTNVTVLETTPIHNDQIVDWRFDDWRATREHHTPVVHTLGLQFSDKSWEQIRGVPVDREGEFVYSLRPHSGKYPERLLCEVKVIENTKIITIRSTYKVENLTLYPLELMLVDETGHPVASLEKIAPGQEYSLPIDAVTKNRIRIQPDQGFGYKWSPAIRYDDLLVRKGFTIKCPHSDPREAAFRFQAWVQTDTNESSARKLPRITLKLRAPLELENLLPYNLEYRIYDKNTDQNWRSYLRKGGVMPVHSVELGHFVLLNVTIQDTVFKPSDFSIINTDGHSDFDIENQLTLRDQQGRKLELRLNYIRYPDSGGAFKVQIYSPYIVVNKTRMPFSVRSKSVRAGSQDAAGDSRPDVLAESLPFLFSHSQEQGNEFYLKLADSAWSKPVSFEAPSAESELVLPSVKQKVDELHLGLSWNEGSGKYKFTKIITLTPRFLVKNMLQESITFREHGNARDRQVLQPGERQAFMAFRKGAEKLLTVAFPGLDAQWSPPINIEDIGAVSLRLKRPGLNNRDFLLVQVDIRIESSTIFVIVAPADKGWPFEIENYSDYVISISQKEPEDQPGLPREDMTYTLRPRTTMDYAWDYPGVRDKKLLLTTNGSSRVVDIMEIGNLVPFKFTDHQRSRAVSLDVRADGYKQILRITNYDPERSLYKPRYRSSSLSRQDTISGAEGFEAVTEQVEASLSVVIDLGGIGVSLVNKRMVEVIYATIDDLKFEYTDSTIAQAINLSCGHLQVDNQLHDALYPVIIQPTPIPRDASGVGALPTVQASVIWLKDQEHGVLFVKYFSVLLQALTIEADEDLLFALYDLSQIQGLSWDDPANDVLIQNPDVIPEPGDTSSGQDVYFEVLELQPIQLAISFMRSERINSEEKLNLRNPLAVVVNALAMTVGNINDAPLEMNALAIKDMRLTLPELQSRILYHYRQEVLRQLYRILGSADFIGNPVGLFTNVSSGVADIFYEPFQGVVMHGNRELGIGLAKGAASFVKKTVFGLSDSFTKFTSSVGKGLSAATFDSEYQAKRRMTQRRNRPRHAIYGVTAGGEAFASSVTSAMEGVLMKPIEGAESEGALGFFKGVGKGLVGAVTKPVVGVFDLASNVSEGIRNTTTVFDNPERDRVRLPRLITADGVLRAYSAREAMGQYWMKDLSDGAYRSEAYVAHINSPGDDNVILLTQSRVLSFWSRKLRLDWELPFGQVQGVTVEGTGVRFSHKAGKAQDKFAFIPDKTSQSWFFGQVASVVKAYNARKRMDV